jgi:hypothetical protein
MSDRNAKKNIAAADLGDTLARLRSLPISTWSYRDEPEGVRHLGPMAQDFRARFGLGDDDRSYNPVDGHGVALASIKALDELVRQQQRRIELLEARNRELLRRLEAIERSRARPSPGR